MALATAELLWVQTLLSELAVKHLLPQVFRDNMGTVALEHNPVLHARTKHLELDLFFVREKVISKQLQVHHVLASVQYANILTKALPPTQLEKFRSKLRVCDSQPS